MVTNVKEGNPPRRLAWVLGALVFAAMFSIFSAESEAGTHWVGSCGATLMGDETYVLVEDIECDVFPAITVVGPAKLQLNGYSVSCLIEDEVPEHSIGILVEGHDGDVLGSGKTAPRLAANTVTGCETGVHVNGDGKHRVQGVTVTRSTDAAFLIESDENKIVGNIIRQNRIWNGPFPSVLLFPVEGSGFVVEGDENLLVANSAADVEGDYGDGVADPDAAYSIHGNWNVLEGNLANDNEAYGFLVAGSNNTLDGNSALKNLTDGFFIAADATKNVLKHNKGFENGDEPKDGDAASGFHVAGPGNTLEENLAMRNGFYGIHVAEGAIGNEVSKNTAFDNLGWDEVEDVNPDVIGGSRIDLLDENACGANKWTLNVFGVRSQSCIK